MTIKEYLINRYGPISSDGKTDLGAFSLLFGNNEEGKTLTIDAIVKMLFNKKSDQNKFQKLQRVEEDPDGYIVVEDNEGKEKKLPDSGDITSILNLSATECGNLFIIRNSDLSISSEGVFYRNITDRLTGLMTEEIGSIKSKLQDFGRLTRPESTAPLSDSRDYESIASRVKDAKKLIDEIQELQEEAQKNSYDKLEEELASTDGEIERIEQDISAIESAEKRERYEKTSKAMGKLREALGKLKDLSVFNNDDEQSWRDAERDLEIHNERKNNLAREIEDKRGEAKKKTERVKGLRRKFGSLESKKKKIDEEIKVELNTYENLKAEAASQTANDKYLKHPTYASTLVLVTLIISLAFTAISLLIILTAVFAVITIILWATRALYAIRKGRLQSNFERVRLNASKLSIEADKVEEIFKRIEDFNDDYDQKRKEIDELDNESKVLEKEVSNKQEIDIPELEIKIGEAEKKIQEIRDNSRVKTLEEYKGNLGSKLQNEKLRDEQCIVLKNQFGIKEKELGNNLRFWDKEVQKLEKFKDSAASLKYDEELLSCIKSNKTEHEGRKKQLLSDIESFKRQLYAIENAANRILRIQEERLLCGSSIDLEAIKGKLTDFIQDTETKKDMSQRIIGIFEELEKEEEDKVHSLFGKKSLVSKYFGEITDGKYKEVEFLPEEKRIIIKNKDGRSLDAEKLSGGAYDQLYLSIRLALGDKLLEGDKGFFLMDDPFIKADKTRLKRQIKILQKIRDMGWQILYFSAKDEVRDCLLKDIEENKVHWIEIKEMQ
jgi:hypothetical protein